MHELSIAMSILELADEEAERRGGVAIAAIHLKIGPLSGVVKEALLSAYELAVEQTPLRECRLILEEVPIAVHCSSCNAERAVRSLQSFTCAECGTPASQIIRGRELQVTALELVE